MKFIKSYTWDLYNLDYVKLIQARMRSDEIWGQTIWTAIIYITMDNDDVVELAVFDSLNKAKERVSALYNLINNKI